MLCMITIVALGNPGDAYANTRHNIGWIVLERAMRGAHLPDTVKSSAYNALLSEGVLYGKDVAVLFPLTFMNNSGVSVAKYLGKQGVSKDLIVVHDEIDLPFGDVRVSVGRGAGGHNGVQSIIDQLKTKDFVRIRVGVGKKNIFGMLKRPQGEALSQFVLGTFVPREVSEFAAIVEKVDCALKLIIEEGAEKAMQVVNAA